MSFSIRSTLYRLLHRQHRVRCDFLTWRKLMRELRLRGQGRRESGAFLLGHFDGDVRVITHFVPYDDIDPRALDRGYVHIDGGKMGKLWAICQQLKVEVVADVHTHPGGVEQSESDRCNPMIAVMGHTAFIVPRFAQAAVRRRDVGMYQYLGSNTWQDVAISERSSFVAIGL